MSERIYRQVLLPIALLFVCGVLLLCLYPSANAEPEYCPYDIHLSLMYSQLSDVERTLFDAMYDAIRTGQTTVDVPRGMTKSDAEWVTDYILNEAPELCAYDKGRTWVSVSAGSRLQVNIAYSLSIAEQDAFIRTVTGIAADFSGRSDADGIRAIHDYLIKRLDYGYVGDEPTWLAYYALKYNKAICNGYSQCAAMFAHFAGYTCSYVDGPTYYERGDYAGRHAWNVAIVNGRFMWFDTTWDDQGKAAGSKWYGLDGEKMAKTHIPDPEYDSIRSRKTVLPEGAWCVMYLDVHNNYGYLRGVADKSGGIFRAADLGPGENYFPAMVIWNSGKKTIDGTVTYRPVGDKIRWYRIYPAQGTQPNPAYRPVIPELREAAGRQRIYWYYDGIPLGSFEWTVK